MRSSHILVLLVGAALGSAISESCSSAHGSAAQDGQQLSAEALEFLNAIRVVEVQTTETSAAPTFRITGYNLQLVNGEGAGSTNGAGNLILGYLDGGDHLDLPFDPEKPRIGSHNLIGGVGASYTGYGGIVMGTDNAQRGPMCSVLGGQRNVADGRRSVVVAGMFNATGRHPIEGHMDITVDGESAAIVGGQGNAVRSTTGTIVGGRYNLVETWDAVIVGGLGGRTSATYSTICGGAGRMIGGAPSEAFDWRAGSLLEDQ